MDASRKARSPRRSASRANASEGAAPCTERERGSPGMDDEGEDPLPRDGPFSITLELGARAHQQQREDASTALSVQASSSRIAKPQPERQTRCAPQTLLRRL